MWYRFTRSIIFNILLGAAALFFAYHAYTLGKEIGAARIEARANEKKFTELQEKKRELERAIEELKHPETIEREAKERLNLKLPGEEVVVVVPTKKESVTTSPNAGFWEKVKFFFR